jgi:hypothetical protein
MRSRADIQIVAIGAELLERVWPLAERFIAIGSRAAGLPLEMELERLSAGMDLLWLIVDGNSVVGAFVTSICDENGRRFVGVSNLSGSGARRWTAKMSATLAEFARHNGCNSVRCYGRKAWSCLLPEAEIIGERGGHMLYERAA